MGNSVISSVVRDKKRQLYQYPFFLILNKVLQKCNDFNMLSLQSICDILSQDNQGRKVVKNIMEKKFCTPSDRRVLVNRCVSYLTLNYGMK